MQWELKQQGVVWNNISIPAIDDDHLSLLAIAGIMAFDAVLYCLLTWYIEGVFPGRYGVSKPWYFPVMPSYWCGQSYAGRAVRRGRTHSVNLLEDEQELMRECICGPKTHSGAPLTLGAQYWTIYSGCRRLDHSPTLDWYMVQ